MWDGNEARLIQGRGIFLLRAFEWKNRVALLPIPKLCWDRKLHLKLNERWLLSWDRKQWIQIFKPLWQPFIPIKKSFLMCLTVHKALWTNERARKLGMGNGLCMRCRKDAESIAHLFINCEANKHSLIFLHACIKPIHPSTVSWKEILLGLSIGCSSGLWNAIRSVYVWNVWISRNKMIFNNRRCDPLPGLKRDLFVQMEMINKIQMQECKARLITIQHEESRSLFDAQAQFDRRVKEIKAEATKKTEEFMLEEINLLRRDRELDVYIRELLILKEHME